MSTVVDMVDINKYVSPELPGCPTALLNQVVIDVVREFCNETQALKCDLDPINIVDTVTDYDLDSPNSYTEIIVPTKVQIYRTGEEPVHPDAQTEEPYSAYTRFDKCVLSLVSAPSEDIVDGLRVRVALRPALDATLLDRRFFRDNYDFLSFGIKARLMMMPTKDWSNERLGLYYQGRYWDGVGKARIDEQRNRVNQRMNARARNPWVGRGSGWL
jgi:hypothetical protein